MKKLVLILLGAFLSLSVMSQDFEGTIQFKVKISGEEFDRYSKAFPESIQLKIKGHNMRGKTSGGQITSLMSGFIFDGDHKTAYVISDAFQTAFKLKSADFDENSKEHATKFDITNTGEKETIAGYECTKYIAKEQGKSTVITIWTTDQFTISKPTNLANLTGNIFLEGVEGFPMKAITNQNNTNMLVEVADVRKEPVDVSAFEIPTGYRIQDFDFSMFNAMLPNGGN
ncbi:MAG: DUF4412 domain-containing protein [Cytophagales bacterium]